MLRSEPHLTKTSVARSFGIARSTLYLTPKQAEKDKMLLREILPVVHDHPHYGHRRVSLVLGKNKKPVLRVMKKYGLTPARRRRKRFRKPQDEGNVPTDIPNRIKHLCPLFPNVVWAGDFTYLSFYGTNVYLATVIDLYTREIVGWSIRLRHSAELVVSALDDAK